MSLITAVAIALLVLTSGFFFAEAIRLRMRLQEALASAASLTTQLDDNNKLLTQSAEVLEKVLAERNALGLSEGQLRGTIGGVCKERDKWRELWHQSAIGAGGAQSMLIEERTRLLSQIARLGARPAINPHVEAIVEAYTTDQVVPARRDRAEYQQKAEAVAPGAESFDPGHAPAEAP